jgi:hypothetical protein
MKARNGASVFPLHLLLLWKSKKQIKPSRSIPVVTGRADRGHVLAHQETLIEAMRQDILIHI